VCLSHLKLSDISKSLGGRMSLKTSTVPSIFAWKQTSPWKRPPPLVPFYMKCLPLKKILMGLSNNYSHLKKNTQILKIWKTKLQALQSNVFSLSLFTSDEVMLFYICFPNYKAFLASVENLDPGDNGENVRYRFSAFKHYVSPTQLSVRVDQVYLNHKKNFPHFVSLETGIRRNPPFPPV